MAVSKETHAAVVDAAPERAGIKTAPERNLWRDAWRRLLRHRPAVVGLVLILLFAVAALLAPVLAPYNYAQQDLLAIYQSPGSAHVLGTDALGRDMLSRLLYGGRVSMSVGLITAVLVLIIGVPAGLVAGYYGGLVDFLLMRLIDVMYAFPNLLLIIIVSAYLGAALPGIHSGPLLVLKNLYDATGGLLAVVLALALFGWLTLARLVRGQVLTLKQREFTEGARAIGASDVRIMAAHLLPNSLAPVIVAAALYVPQAIFAEAGLSFIGLGVKAPTPSWGIMISDGIQAIQSHPYVAIEPALAIAVVLMSFNFLGDGLRDALDPFMNR